MQNQVSVPIITDSIAEFKTLSFSGGRVSANLMAHGGLSEIKYYGRQRFGGAEIFKADMLSAWVELFRIILLVGNDEYYLPFGRTEVYPFGYRSSAEIAGVICEHELLLANETIYLRLSVIANPTGAPLRAALVINETCTVGSKSWRQWDHFKFDAKRNAGIAVAHDRFPEEKRAEGTLAQQGGFTIGDVSAADIFVGVTSTAKLTFHAASPRFRRLTFSTAEAIENQIGFAVTFAPDAEAFDRNLDAAADCNARCAEIYSRWEMTVTTQTTINCPTYPAIAETLAYVRPILDSLKVKDLPGAMRAADSGYWVWGWDTMIYSEAWLWSGDFEFVLDILDYYCRTADVEKGIFHAARLDNVPYLAMAPAAQTLYCAVLYKYYCHTGDLKVVGKYYNFAMMILNQAKATRVNGYELLVGVGMYPDHPEDLDQDGHDISSFNNSIYYQALRAMAKLSEALGHCDEKLALEQTATQLLQEIRQHLFDTEKGYFYDSISSIDFTPRRHYPLYAVLWATPFAVDLMADNQVRIAEFMAKNFTAAHGPRILPKWDTAWKGDGNQLCMYMPVIEKVYREMMRRNGYNKELEQYFETVKWFWSQFTFPEALTARIDNYELSFDNYGRKQGFTAKAWYSIFLETICGLQSGDSKLKIENPYLGNIVIDRLTYCGKKFKITIDNNKNSTISCQ